MNYLKDKNQKIFDDEDIDVYKNIRTKMKYFVLFFKWFPFLSTSL